jgi:hypothetical protein
MAIDFGWDRVVERLALYLVESGRAKWPGMDGLTIRDVVEAAYVAEAAAGHVPRADELIRRHPDSAEAIRELFVRSDHCDAC